MSDKPVKPKTRSVSVPLIEDVGNNFDVIKADMIKRMPGIKPDNASVLRHTLHQYAEQIRTDNTSH